MKKVDFRNGTIVQNILQTALPMLVAQVLTLLYNIVDRIYIGRIPEVGTEALGAVGFCFPLIIVVTAFTNMFGMGGSPLFSMALGRGDKDKASAILNTALKLLVICAIPLMVLGELFAEPVLTLFGAGKEELAFALPYLRIYLTGTLFSMVATGINPYINAEGYSLYGMATVTVGAVANLLLDPLFIFAFDLGVEGAAIATVLSQFLSMLFVIHFLKSPGNEFPIHLVHTADGKFFPYGKDIAGLGTVPFIMQITNSLVNIVCNQMLMQYGGALYVSAMTTVSSVRQILDTPVMAITEGSSPSISFNYGARQPDRVRKSIMVMTFMAIPYTAVIWLLIMVKPDLFIRIFTTDQSLIEVAAPALHLYFYAFIFQSLQYSGQTVFKALNQKKQAIFFSLFRKVILVVPLTLLLPGVFHLGTDGVFMAEPISNLIGGSACFLTMILTMKPELKRMRDHPARDTDKA
ncbi:MAG: MATE family efflux transporter [Lachnospiraceae bacterium]|nr:MATE family efflux transporter [Lachnospiraceae bacterium]